MEEKETRKKFDPDKYLQSVFSPEAEAKWEAMMNAGPVAVVPAIEIQRANRRIYVSLMQNRRERGDYPYSIDSEQGKTKKLK